MAKHAIFPDFYLYELILCFLIYSINQKTEVNSEYTNNLIKKYYLV